MKNKITGRQRIQILSLSEELHERELLSRECVRDTQQALQCSLHCPNNPLNSTIHSLSQIPRYQKRNVTKSLCVCVHSTHRQPRRRAIL
jgi:hypothetical protein